jgi:hypothetical protein
VGEATNHGPTETTRTLITEIAEAHGTTYQLWAELNLCDRPSGMMELKFQSRWSGARQPDELQDRGRFLLDETAMRNLRSLLDQKQIPIPNMKDIT